MLSLYFGNYLIAKQMLTQNDLVSIIQNMKEEKVFLGFAAYITQLASYEDILALYKAQQKYNIPFEVIGVKKGYFEQKEVEFLMIRSKENFYQFLQNLVSRKLFTTEEILALLKSYKEEKRLSNATLEALQKNDIHKIWPLYIQFDSGTGVERNLQAYQMDNKLSNDQMGSLTKKDVKKIVPSFVYQDPIFYNDFFDIVFNNISQLITPQIYIEKSLTVHKHRTKSISYQSLKGSHKVFFGIAGEEEHLLYIANKYGYTDYKEPTDDTHDAVCEFINCINGIFASKSSNNQIPLEILPPKYHKRVILQSKGPIYIIPVWLHTHPLELVISIDAEVEIIN